MKTVIIAGGKGARISSVASDIPKPMIKIEGKPVLEHEIECLRDQGFMDIIITVSHLGNMIMDYFGDGTRISPVTGKLFGVHIEYCEETTPFGNAGLHVISSKVLDMVDIDPDAVDSIGPDGKVIKIDLDRQILKPLTGTGKMFCYDSPE